VCTHLTPVFDNDEATLTDDNNSDDDGAMTADDDDNDGSRASPSLSPILDDAKALQSNFEAVQAQESDSRR
jgi:hypothetical protein